MAANWTSATTSPMPLGPTAPGRDHHTNGYTANGLGRQPHGGFTLEPARRWQIAKPARRPLPFAQDCNDRQSTEPQQTQRRRFPRVPQTIFNGSCIGRSLQIHSSMPERQAAPPLHGLVSINGSAAVIPAGRHGRFKRLCPIRNLVGV